MMEGEHDDNGFDEAGSRFTSTAGPHLMSVSLVSIDEVKKMVEFILKDSCLVSTAASIIHLELICPIKFHLN